MSKIYAPWDEETVNRLNAVQSCNFMHPYTCACGASLIATPGCWVCDACEYTQDWAGIPPPPEDMDMMRKVMAGLRGEGA